MAKKESTGGTKIVVDLGGVKLPAAVAKELEANIRHAVLGALAGVDLGTNMTIRRPRFPPGTIGIIAQPAQ